MTPLRQRMLEDMQVRNLALNTQESYVQQVTQFARHFGQSPEELGPEAIRAYQVYLTKERQLAPGSISIAVAALRFLYKVTLQRDWPVTELIPAPKKPQTLPVVLSRAEVQQFLASVPLLKHRTILSVCYAAGLRISEAVRLQPPHIDSQRMVIRVEQGKGQKDRYVMLSPRLLELLRAWWRFAKPWPWLFPGREASQPLTPDAVQEACQKAQRRCGIPKPITPARPAARLRRASARRRHRRAHDPAPARAPEPGDHGPLPADRDQHRVRHLESVRPAPAAECPGAAAHATPVLLTADPRRRCHGLGSKWRTSSVATERRTGRRIP